MYTTGCAAKIVKQVRGGHSHINRKRDWETAVKRGKGGFPGPRSWDPMDKEELRVKAETLLAPEIPDPVIEQFEPTRDVLWRRWKGTILEDTWTATLTNMGLALVVCLLVRRLEDTYPQLHAQLVKVDTIWKIQMTLTTFILTFFVNQSYALWRTVYATTRALQGRLNDMYMLTTTHLLRESCATPPPVVAADTVAPRDDFTRRNGVAGGNDGRLTAEHCLVVDPQDTMTSVGEVAPANCKDGSGSGFSATGIGNDDVYRDLGTSDSDENKLKLRAVCFGNHEVETDGSMTELSDSVAWLAQFIRYTRLWHVLFYAGCSRKHACFCTDSGLARLRLCGLVTEEEVSLLTALPGPPAHRHVAAFQWMVALFLKGAREKRFHETLPLTTRMMEQFILLRGKSGSISDLVGGRTKLAYAHAVQLLVDVFLLLTPFALFSEVGFWSIAVTGVLTTFYQGLFNLSKTFIDPLDNEDATIDSDCIVVDSLIKESANNAARWMQAAARFPF